MVVELVSQRLNIKGILGRMLYVDDFVVVAESKWGIMQYRR